MMGNNMEKSQKRRNKKFVEIDPKKNEFVQSIQSFMKDKGISQEILADITGIKKNTISDWIRLNQKPNYDTIKLLSEKLELPTDYFFGSKVRSKDPGIQGICKKTGLSEKTVNELILYAEHKKNDTPFKDYSDTIDNVLNLILDGSFILDFLSYDTISNKFVEEFQELEESVPEDKLDIYGGSLDQLYRMVDGKSYHGYNEKLMFQLFTIQRELIDRLEGQHKEKINKIESKYFKRQKDYNSKKMHAQSINQ